MSHLLFCFHKRLLDGKRTLFSRNVFLWFTWNHSHWSYFHYTHTENTHTVNKMKVHMLHCIQTNTQSITYLHMQSHTGMFLSLHLLASTGKLKSFFVGSLHVLPKQIYKASKQSRLCVTHAHTRTLLPLLPPRYYVLWLANWLASRLWLWRNLAGRNWKMGSPLFSPLGWTKDQSFQCFLHWSNRKRWSTRCPSGWITTIGCTCWTPLEWQLC